MSKSIAGENVGALIAAKASLDNYNKAMDKVVVWEEFEKTLEIMVQYQQDHSTNASDSIGNITTLLRDAKVEYHNATRSVYEWCSLTIPLLNAFLRRATAAQSTSVEAQKKILSKVFSEGVKKMSLAITQLDHCSHLLNEATGELVTLTTQLRNDFNDSSDYFQEKVREIRVAYCSAIAGSIALGPIGLAIVVSLAGITELTVVRKLRSHFMTIQNDYLALERRNQGFANHIVHATGQLKKDKNMISAMSARAGEAQTYCEIPDFVMHEITTAARDLVNLCEAYKRRHGHAP